MAAQMVDNTRAEWNFQNYIIEAMGPLGEECTIDEDENDYKKGINKKELQRNTLDSSDKVRLDI